LGICAQKQYSPGKRNKKLDEEAFDYNRKAMYTVTEHNGETKIILKALPDNVLTLCKNILTRKNFMKVDGP